MSATVPEALRHPVLRRFRLRRLRLPVGGQTLDVVVPDASEWIRRGDWVAARTRGEEPPYWVQVWPASVAIARALSRRRGLAGLRVLDLGCGLGVPGVAAAALGAEVTFVDREASAVAFATWNAEKAAGRPQTGCVSNWFHGVTPGCFDLILLADVTYHPGLHEPVLRQIRAGLAEDGVLVHCDPLRAEATPFVVQVANSLPSLLIEQSVWHEERRTRVRLLVASASREVLQAWSKVLVE